MKLPSWFPRRAAGESRDGVRPDDLNVAPDLLGLPLASAPRRLAAMLIDITLIVLVARFDRGWILLAALLWAVATVWATRRGRVVPRWQLSVIALLAAWGLWAAVQDLRQPAASPKTQAAAAAASTAADELQAALDAVTRNRAEGNLAALDRATGRALAASARRIDELQAALERARKTELEKMVDSATHWLDDAGLGYGWGLLYFSFVPAWTRGRTLGKQLLGLRTVELTGKPMTALLGLRRYGGYAAGLATGGLGLAQILWDTNRQALHDKAAHTVVLDERGAARAPA
jgi:hypothetical protein